MSSRFIGWLLSAVLVPITTAAPAASLDDSTLKDSSSRKVRLIRFGTLVDGTGRVLKDVTVTIEGDRITKVQEGKATPPPGAELIDLSRYTGIPGLIDAHTHVTYYYDPATKGSPLRQSYRLPAVNVFLAQENARKTLECGVTTIHDLGASDYDDIALRDLINRGKVTGPRMFVAGHGLLLVKSADLVPYKGAARGVKDIERVVREQVQAGADVIKMWGSRGGFQDVRGDQTFSLEEMKAAVQAAHKLKKRIAIHSYGPAGVRAALEAGADSIEHGADLDDDLLKEMARKKVVWVPTIDHNRYYAENAGLYGWTKAQVAKLNDYLERNLKSAQRAHAAGVRFAMGSDAVFTMFGENTRELAWFVKAGMTPAQALQTATVHGADLLGMDKSLGAVAPGYFADLAAVEGDPLKDIEVVIRKARWVMKGGQVVIDKTGWR
jgi:imidazolonepropionase-like amidohydrolase